MDIDDDVELGGDAGGYANPYRIRPFAEIYRRAPEYIDRAAGLVSPAVAMAQAGGYALDWIMDRGPSDSSDFAHDVTLREAAKDLSRNRKKHKSMWGATSSSRARGYGKAYSGQHRGQRVARPRVRYNRSGGYVNKDYKFYDSNLELTTGLNSNADCSQLVVDPPTINTLVCPGTGDSAFTREGQNLWLKSLQIKGTVYIPGQALDNTDVSETLPTVKIWIVLDKQTNKAQMNSTDVFFNGMTAAGTCISAVRNAEYTTRFKVLKEITIRPASFGSALTHYYNGTTAIRTGAEVPFMIYIKFKKGLKIRMTGSAAGIASVMDNSLHMCACSSVPKATTQVNLFYNSRARFLG